MNHRLVSIVMTVSIIMFINTACLIPYRSMNQLDLHTKLSQKKMKVAVLPFTLNTPPKEKRLAFENFDVNLTNEFTKIIWKKNKVKIAHKEEVLKAISDSKIKYDEMNPEMDDLAVKPNLSTVIEIGKQLGVNVVFLGTVRTNKFDYEGGCCILIPSFMAKKRVYNVGAQMMAIDVDKGEVLAFDFINNKLAVKTKFYSLTGGVSDKAQTGAESKLLEKCGFALAYYAPKPEKRTDKTAIGLQTGAALLNLFAGTDFTVETYIKDDTWKMYPEGYFEKNYGYSDDDIMKIKSGAH